MNYHIEDLIDQTVPETYEERLANAKKLAIEKNTVYFVQTDGNIYVGINGQGEIDSSHTPDGLIKMLQHSVGSLYLARRTVDIKNIQESELGNKEIDREA